MRRWSRASGVLVMAVALLAVVGASGCGYALAGRGNTLPASIKIIGIPLFVNHSQTPDIDQVLTQAVREEFGNHGKYTIKPDGDGADAVLTATINSVTLHRDGVQPASTRRAATRSSSRRTSSSRTSRTTTRCCGRIRRSCFATSTTSTRTSPAIDAAAFFRQDANALERLAKNFARSVVTSILEAF